MKSDLIKKYYEKNKKTMVIDGDVHDVIDYEKMTEYFKVLEKDETKLSEDTNNKNNQKNKIK